MLITRLKRWAQPELDRTLVLLRQANRQLDHALTENIQLKAQNERLTEQVQRLTIDNQELHRQMALLKQANDMQKATIERMERYQLELQNRLEHLIARVVQLELRLGDRPQFPIA